VDAKQLFKAAISRTRSPRASEEVKRHPSDSSPARFLCELLCFAGDWPRPTHARRLADSRRAQLMFGISMFRQLIRARAGPAAVYADGRVPEFLETPTGSLECCLKASIALREETGRGRRVAGGGRKSRPVVSGVCDDSALRRLRDVDDLAPRCWKCSPATASITGFRSNGSSSSSFVRPSVPDLLWAARPHGR